MRDDGIVRFGVLGCGAIAQSAHFDACRKARNAELYAICDTASDLVDRMKVAHQPRVSFTDYDDMLADSSVDAIIIATADEFHVPLSMRALRAGKHVLVEKPMGLTVEECEELCGVVEKTGLQLQVGTNRRFDPGVRFARDFAADIGERLGFKAWYYDSIYRYTQTDNLLPLTVEGDGTTRPRTDPKANRQHYLLITHGSHLVDTCRFVGGEIARLSARFRNRFNACCWFVSLEFEDGSLGHLDLSVPVQGEFEEGFHLYGEHGSILARGPLPWYHQAWTVECYSSRDGIVRRPTGEDAYSYKLEIEEFANVVATPSNASIGATVTDGLAAVRALVAIARSAEQEGKWIRPAEVNGAV